MKRAWVPRLALAAMAAQALFTLDWIVNGFLTERWSFFDNTISDIGALEADQAAVYNVLLSLSGLLTLALPVALLLWFGRASRLLVAGAVSIAVFGVGQFLDGLLREDCWPTTDGACRAAMEAGDLSWHHTGHEIESVLTVLALVASTVLLALAFRRIEGWEDISAPSWAAFIFLVGGFAAFVPLYDDSARGVGLVQKLAVTVGVGWLAYVAGRLWSVSSSEAEDRSTELAR